MPTGTVKFYNEDKGYGFITQDDGGPDVFLHVTDVRAAKMNGVMQDDRLEFEIGEGPKGPKARNIKRC